MRLRNLRSVGVRPISKSTLHLLRRSYQPVPFLDRDSVADANHADRAR